MAQFGQIKTILMLMKTLTRQHCAHTVVQMDIITSSSLSLCKASLLVCYSIQFMCWQLVTHQRPQWVSVGCVWAALPNYFPFPKMLIVSFRLFRWTSRLKKRCQWKGLDYAYASSTNCRAVCVANNIFSSSYKAHYHMEPLARTAVEGRPTYFR